MPVVILRPYALSLKNRVMHSRALSRDTFFVLASIALMWAIYATVISILTTFSQDPLLGLILPKKIIELLFYAFFWILLVSNTISAVVKYIWCSPYKLFIECSCIEYTLVLREVLGDIV